MMTTIPYSKLPKQLERFADKIDGYDCEPENDMGRHWVYLKRGFYSPAMGCHTLHERSLREIVSLLRRVEPCDCADCKRETMRERLTTLLTALLLAQRYAAIEEMIDEDGSVGDGFVFDCSGGYGFAIATHTGFALDQRGDDVRIFADWKTCLVHECIFNDSEHPTANA